MVLSNQSLKTCKDGDAMTSLNNLFDCYIALLENAFLPSVQSENLQTKTHRFGSFYLVWQCQEEFGSHNCP